MEKGPVLEGVRHWGGELKGDDSFTSGMTCSSKMNAVYIIGLGHKYPPHSMKQEHFMELMERLHPDEVASSTFQKLGRFNSKTKILSRPTILDFTKWSKEDAMPPEVDSISRIFRTAGVQLAASACKEAMREARLGPSDITHTVAVTCTDQSNPGYDHFVSQELGLQSGVQRLLIHGVGCAGGLSALRAAADIAAAASQRGRPARILVMACELCSLFLRAELQAALQDGELHVGPALFSDGAAALVVCNRLALKEKQMPVFELIEWGSMVVPGTLEYMSYDVEKNGMIATISKFVPEAAIRAIIPMFGQLRAASTITHKTPSVTRSQASKFDWAIHPGGASILQGAKQALHLTDHHIRASLDVYQNYGNSSSPTVLIVLDKLRKMGEGRENVIATSFGPGLTIEMCMMRRCRSIAARLPSRFGEHTNMHAFWLSLRACLSKRRPRRPPRVIEVAEKKSSGYIPIVR